MPGPQKINLEPEIDLEDEEEEPSLPALVEETAPPLDAAEAAAASGADVIVGYAKLAPPAPGVYRMIDARGDVLYVGKRSEEHTSELQSHVNLVCRLLLEKKKSSN